MNKPLEYMKISLLMLVFTAVSACTTHIALATMEKELDNQLDYTDKYNEQVKEKETSNVY